MYFQQLAPGWNCRTIATKKRGWATAVELQCIVWRAPEGDHSLCFSSIVPFQLGKDGHSGAARTLWSTSPHFVLLFTQSWCKLQYSKSIKQAWSHLQPAVEKGIAWCNIYNLPWTFKGFSLSDPRVFIQIRGLLESRIMGLAQFVASAWKDWH